MPAGLWAAQERLINVDLTSTSIDYDTEMSDPGKKSLRGRLCFGQLETQPSIISVTAQLCRNRYRPKDPVHVATIPLWVFGSLFKFIDKLSFLAFSLAHKETFKSLQESCKVSGMEVWNFKMCTKLACNPASLCFHVCIYNSFTPGFQVCGAMLLLVSALPETPCARVDFCFIFHLLDRDPCCQMGPVFWPI